MCVPFLKEKACELLEKYPTRAREASDSGVGKGIILVSRGLHALGVESLRSEKLGKVFFTFLELLKF